MTDVEKAKSLLDLDALELPPDPKVLAIEVEDFVDWTGDDMLRVFVTIDEDVDIDKLTGQMVLNFKSAIRKKLRSNGIEKFALISIGKPSELEENPFQG